MVRRGASHKNDTVLPNLVLAVGAVRVVPGRDKDGRPFGGAAFTTVGGEYDLQALLYTVAPQVERARASTSPSWSSSSEWPSKTSSS